MRTHGKWRLVAACVSGFLLVGFLWGDMLPEGGTELKNENVEALFGEGGLVAVRDRIDQHAVHLESDSASLVIDGRTLDTASLALRGVTSVADSVAYTYAVDGWELKAVYELKPDWRFVSKRLILCGTNAPAWRVQDVCVFRGELTNPVSSELALTRHKWTWGACLRFGSGNEGSPGVLCLLQNPFMTWERNARSFVLSYKPDMDWKAEYGAFETDRACLIPYVLSGTTHVRTAMPEWKYMPDADAVIAGTDKIDMAEIDAYQSCVAAFLEFHPRKSVRIHVGWCENDYQLDCGTSEGRAEYKRIIDRTADIGGEYLLYGPGNSQVSDVKACRDAWGWENVLWLGMGQKIRRDEWDPATDALPASVQEMVDYAASRGVKLVAYAYPSVPWMQDPAWTQWCNNKPGGYAHVDTGVRSFQDFFVQKLVAFHKKTGVGGFAFDHWWIAYDSIKENAHEVSSRYAQWYGCRRILSELRRAVPDIVIDGRQQYHWFGPWTWVGGTYPHPFGGDEQPGSFRAGADLHTDRVSANHVRWVNWRFRMENFCPPEMIPGYMTHQTQRSDAKGVMRRDPWRRADWDYLGWKYSVLSSIATAPYNHVLNFIPARDEAEFKAFSQADQAWWRGWLDWSDHNREILRNMRFIMGPPMVGRTDGTAAFKGDRGFVFLFNPNYRRLTARFSLDASLGLSGGSRFIVTQLHPQRGLRVGKVGTGVWSLGDEVAVPMEGAGAMVLSVAPAPAVTVPVLFNATGQAFLENGRLELSDVRGETGTRVDLLVSVAPGESVATLRVNGVRTLFERNRDTVSATVSFVGAPFGRCRQVGTYDPAFTGGAFKGTFTIPARIAAQLRAREAAWTVSYSEDDLVAPWVGPDRLLLFVNIAEAKPDMSVSISIDDRPVEVRKAFNGIYPNSGDQTFIGFYADVTALDADRPHRVEVGLPTLLPGQFQGLFFDNVETEYTQTVVPAPGAERGRLIP